MKPLIQVLGATGVGKSQVAFALAGKFGAEIISADSVQVYRGFDIGTDKVDPRRQREILHHLIDIIDDCSQFNASKFLELSFSAAEKINTRGRIPLVCGGTGLYLRVMSQGIFAENKNNATRRQLEEKAALHGWPALWQELQAIDPVYAEKISPHDKVRLVRALEIHRHCGLPPSEAFRHSRSPFSAYAFIRIGLEMDRKKLYERIDRRVERMIERGLVAEVEALLKRHPPACPPFKALGYKEIVAHLRGETDLETALELIQRHSRQFAKRQLSWFRQEKDIQWFDPGDLDAMASHIRACIAKKP
ncbi:MAG: tRNA (adenosine(37)-N6)-dimethylallyltransferase MiaA [Candidatus Aminicenantes bacterium]|nr:tRNA (adenosine(37)-N6)-dimethylallyltransferase MiaA [Candidatus Aminicenantes bacterium]